MQDYEEFIDEELDDGKEVEKESREELLEEDEITSREEAFLKGYDDAVEEDEGDEGTKEDKAEEEE